MLALFAAGVIVRRRDGLVLLLASMPVYMTVVYAATLILARYLFPVMPFVIAVGALGIEGVVDAVRARRTAPMQGA